MKKTLRTVVAALLILVMLFSVSVTTIFAAEKSLPASNDNMGAIAPTTPSTGNTASGAVLDLGWVSVTYDEDSLDIVWYHDFTSMLNSMAENPDVFKDLSELIVEGIEHLVIDSLEGQLSSGSNNGNGITVDINDMEGLLKTAINSYLDINSTDPDYLEKILAFFEELLGEDMSAAGSEAHNFSLFICDLISFAVSSGKIALEELKAKIADGAALKSLIDEKIYDIIDYYAETFITEKVPGMIEDYVAELKGEPNDLPDEILEFIENVAVGFAKSQTKAYLENKTGELKIDATLIETFVYAQVTKVLKSVLANYAEMTKTPGYKFWDDEDAYASAYQLGYNKVNDYVNLAIDNYIKILCGITVENPTVLDGELQTNSTVESVFNGFISGEIDDIIDYIEGGRVTAKPATYDIFDAAITSYFATTKITDDMLTAAYASFLTAQESTFKNLFETQFDTELQIIIDYIAGGRVGTEPANYGVFATLLSNYFTNHNTIDTIPSSILIKYINSNKTSLSDKFGEEFDDEYEKLINGETTALYGILESAFNNYFSGKSFDDIDKALIAEYLDLKGNDIKTEFVNAKLNNLDYAAIVNDIVAYVKACADPNVQVPAVEPDYYLEFERAFNAKGIEYMGITIDLDDVKGNINIANAVFTTENVNELTTELEAEVRAKVDSSWNEIIAYAKLENPTTPAPENYEVFKTEFNNYLASNAITFATIGTNFLATDAVKSFIKMKVNFEYTKEEYSLISDRGYNIKFKILEIFSEAFSKNG